MLFSRPNGSRGHFMTKDEHPMNGKRLAALGLALTIGGAAAGPVAAQGIQQLLEGVVRVRAFVPPEARTAPTLGRERDGSGVVIDQSGLVLTIGYLIVEASGATVTLSNGRTVAAQIAAYDHETGFGLLRAIEPLGVRPVPFARPIDVKERDAVLIATGGGAEAAAPAFVVSRRTFAGNWEYMIDGAIFTSPPHPNWSGAALLDRDGKLIGIGSLAVGDASGASRPMPGNMFVPIDLLLPILGDMIAEGRAIGTARPWLGITTEELRGRLFIARVTPGGPAERAGLRAGDMIMGVAGEQPKDLMDFYRKIYAQGGAGAVIPLTVMQGGQMRSFTIESVDRYTQLRLRSTY